MSLIPKFKFLKNILLANFKERLNEPYKITINITDQCNSRCKTCGIWKKEPKNELSAEEIKKIFKNLKTDWINITGGEIFLKENLIEIFKIIKDEINPAVINITTNGLLPQTILEKTKQIIALNFSQIVVVVSLDGPPEIHDNIRGIEGSYKKSIETFELLKKLKNRNVKIFFGYTISKYNVGYFKKTTQIVKNIIPKSTISDWHINLFQISKHYYNNIESQASPDQKILLNEISQIQKNRGFAIAPINFLENMFLKNLKKYIKTKRTPMPCSALCSSCFIDSNGKVYPCIHYGKEVGNLRKNKFNLLKIWNSPEAKKIGNDILKNRCPNCWTSCEANPLILNNILKNPLKWISR